MTNQIALQFSVLLFAALKDAAGADHIAITVREFDQAQKVSVAQLLECCAQQHPQLAAWLPHVKVAVNFEYSNKARTVGVEDEIAFLPPVSGGA